MKRVLIVDDEAHITAVLKLHLERAGYSVETANNGKTGFEAVTRRAPDALITDIQMPLMTGRELCLAIEQALPARTFPILVMTSRTDREEREWTSAIRLLEFLEKPVSMRSVVSRLEKHLGARPAPAGTP
jgi:two-component system, OmpR family, alkaline phosphatase synthesis response regulator PhoP